VAPEACSAPSSAASSSASSITSHALVPDLAYFVLFLPMVLVLVFCRKACSERVQL